MHRLVYSIRTIADADLPRIAPIGAPERAATDAELLSFGLRRLHDDVFEVVEQHRRDPDTLAWSPHGPPAPVGAIVAAGSHRERYAAAARSGHAAKIFRAAIASGARPLVGANLRDLAAMLDESVGDVDGAPFLDVADPETIRLEAARLVEIPANGVERLEVPGVLVGADDVVLEDGIVPHHWAGEAGA